MMNWIDTSLVHRFYIVYSEKNAKGCRDATVFESQCFVNDDRRNLRWKDPEMFHEVVPTRGLTPAGGAKGTNLFNCATTVRLHRQHL